MPHACAGNQPDESSKAMPFSQITNWWVPLCLIHNGTYNGVEDSLSSLNESSNKVHSTNPALFINSTSPPLHCEFLIHKSRTQRVLITPRTRKSHLNPTNSVRQSPMMISTSHHQLKRVIWKPRSQWVIYIPFHELNEFCTYCEFNKSSEHYAPKWVVQIPPTQGENRLHINTPSSTQLDECCTYCKFNKSFEHHELKRVIWKPRTQWVIYILRTQWSCR